jgi:capsular polysaccharide biosynthesis protein
MIPDLMRLPRRGSIQWPDVVELGDITIAPLLPGNSKTNLALEADPPTDALFHYRYGSLASTLRVLPVSAGVVPQRIVEERVIYGGLLFRHFGHALTESLHRLWPRFAVKELHGAPVAFSLVNNANLMPYVVEALNLHGIKAETIIRIDEPILFRRLFVGPQARQMAGPTIVPNYQAMLDESLTRRLPHASRRKRLYVSRLHHHHTGSFYGESLVESALAAEGFEVIYPERLTLTELVTVLRDSRIAVFAEGSAIHALELCGTSTPDVFVIGRRKGSVDRFTPLLSNICKRWTVSDGWRFSVGMSADRKKHSGVLDLLGVLGDLCSFAGLPDDHGIDAATARAAVQNDLDQHIEDERNERTPDYEVRAEAIRRQVKAAS